MNKKLIRNILMLPLIAIRAIVMIPLLAMLAIGAAGDYLWNKFDEWLPGWQR